MNAEKPPAPASTWMPQKKRPGVCVPAHKGQNLAADGLGLVPHSSCSPWQAWKPYRTNKDSPSPLLWAVHTPQTTQTPHTDTHSSVEWLNLNGQRNYPQTAALLFRKGEAHICAFVPAEGGSTDTNTQVRFIKGNPPQRELNTFLPFWVCPSSMSSSIVLMLF